MGKVINKQLGILQKAQILDKEKRIIRLKASDSGYDRDQDRLNAEGWKMPNYNIPFVDSHKTHNSMDKRLGEVINAFYQDGFWWNDVQLDIPGQEAAGWTEGEKLANRIWNMALQEKDIRTSVGFIPDLTKIKQNEKGGLDYSEQEQTELSAVLMPSNSRAGNKATGDILLSPTDTLAYKLKKKLIEKYPIGKHQYCDVLSPFLDEVVYNVYGEGIEGYWDDKYYKIGYVRIDQGVALIGDSVEVSRENAYIEKESQEQETTKLLNTVKIKLSQVITKETIQKVKDIDIDAKVSKAISKLKIGGRTNG